MTRDQIWAYDPQAALVDSTGAFTWHEVRSWSREHVLEEVLNSWLMRAISAHRLRLEMIDHHLVDDRKVCAVLTLNNPEMEHRHTELIVLGSPPYHAGLTGTGLDTSARTRETALACCDTTH